MNEPKDNRPDNKAKNAGPSTSDTSINPPAKKELTPEEQMALYEENLKETDWGHQPC